MTLSSASFPTSLRALLLGAIVAAASVAQAEDSAKQHFIQGIAENVPASGLVEVTAAAGRGFDKKDTSDVTLSTAQFGLDAQIEPWATGHLLFLYEEDDTEPVDVDEGTITLGGTAEIPYFLTVGKMYVAFGVFDSSMISDPLTLELGETGQSAVDVGFMQNGFYASAYGFNCDVDEAGEEEPDQIKCFGAHAGYAVESEETEVSYGVEAGYISNLADTDGFEGYLTDSELKIDDQVGGYTLYANFGVESWKFMGELVAATGDIDYTSGKADAPLAWNVEMNYRFEMMGKEALFGLGYQATDNLAGFLPESRILGTFGLGLSENLTAAVEYAWDKDYSAEKGGTGENANTVSAQLALSF